MFDYWAMVFAIEQESHNIQLLKNEISSLQDNMVNIAFDFVSISKYDKEKIKKHLICTCDQSVTNLIILTGKITVFSMLSDITNEIIDNDISNEHNEINELILDLTKELQHTFKRLLCGVRHQTLIITTCDFYPNITLMFEKYEILIKDILDCMADEYEIIASKNNDNFEKSSNSDIDDSEMTSHLTKSEKEMKEMLITKLYKKSEENIMISVDQAIRILKDMCNKKYFKINIQTVNIIDAYNKILIMDVFSTIDFPSCRTSAKHGYAMLASNETSGKDVRKVLKAHPKFVEISIEPGTCVRVRSGDPIPKGANTVVTPKNIKILDECNDNNDDYDYFNIDDKEYEIEVLVAPKINENIRNAGYLIKHNEYILKRFKRIGSSELGILTLCGIDSILVIKVLSIGVLSISRFEENILGRIYESNRIILTSLLKENGYNLTDFGISACQLDAIKKKIEDALNEVDILVIMGPVNDKDILKAILKECFGANIHFGCLDMKPGKSTTFASCMYNCKRKFFLCMSANPATVPIVAHVVLLPFLNMIHRNCSTPIVMQICIKNHELHLRPKFSWTTAQWTKDETFPRACCSKNQHQNIMKYQKANALLNLPKYTSEVPKLDAAFVPTMFVD